MTTPTFFARLRAEAGAIRAAPPDDGTGRRANPVARWLTVLRRAGWPVEAVVVTLPALTSDGRPCTKGDTLSCVPEAWLRLLAVRLGVPWAEACRRTVERG